MTREIVNGVNLTDAPAYTRAGLLKANEDMPLVKRFGDMEAATDHILARYIGGQSIKEIVTDLGVSQERAYILLLKHAPDRWKEAQAGKALRKLDDAEEELEEAADGVKIGRAREQARLQCWRLERVARSVYGQDGAPVQVNINLGNVGEQLRELEAELLQVAKVRSSNAPQSLPLDAEEVTD